MSPLVRGGQRRSSTTSKLRTDLGPRWVALLALCFASGSGRARAHDLALPLIELERGAARLEKTLRYFRSVPAIPRLPETDDDQRRVLGAAEVERALGHDARALELLMGRLADPRFHGLPEYVETLLLASEILERSGEDVGAMHYAELALARGGTPDEMAEAGARWFRIARRHQRLDRRLEVYDLWRSQGGERAAGTETAAEVAYEIGFLLRLEGDRRGARRVLAGVPSDTAFGSRAAFMAGVSFVEEGDLTHAERWFSALMTWPLPELPREDPRMTIEIEIRELAALSAARLRYERGDLAGAEDAYRGVAHGSRFEADACWEGAFLDLDRKRRRGALKKVQCVIDLGARGSRFVDAKLFGASLLAHLSRYEDSVESYERLHAHMDRERDLFVLGSKRIDRPADFLFEGMERNAVDRGREASPGAATLFGEAWTAEVDQAYRIDRGLDHARRDLTALGSVIDRLIVQISAEDGFVVLSVRRDYLERVLREIQHLLGHAGELEDVLRLPHAAALGSAGSVPKAHAADMRSLSEVTRALIRLAEEAENDLTVVNRLEIERRSLALGMLREIRVEVSEILQRIEELERDSEPALDAVASEAIGDLRAAIQDAAMRAEVGVLDTHWLKKEHLTKAIERLLRLQKEAEDQAKDALEGLLDDGMEH